MRILLSLFVFILLLTLSVFSLSFADFANYAGPQLEYISNAFPMLWGQPTAKIEQIMSIFPDFNCKAYEGQYVCTSKFNTDRNNNIYINFFTDDYEEHHDNLWKVAVTADAASGDQIQSLFRALWIDGMKPFHTKDDEFWFERVVPLYFSREDTKMVAWFQPYQTGDGGFFLAEYYSGYRF